MHAYADDSTLLEVVFKAADRRPDVAVSLNRHLARIPEWCNHWYIIPNPSKPRLQWLVDPGL